MTGLELLEGLSFVDAKYIQEAETAELHRNTPWMKVLSVAACICILITGVFAYSQMQSKDAMESIPEAVPEAAAPQKAPAEPMYEEAAPMETECAAPKQESAAEEGPPLYGVSYAQLRIVNVLDEGEYVGVVEDADTDFDIFEVGMQVNLVIAPDRVTVADRVDTDYAENITADMMVEIQNGIYDVDTGVLYVAGLLPSE